MKLAAWLLCAWVLCALVVLGCAPKVRHWNKAGATEQQFRGDSYECAQQARQTEINFAGRFGGMSDGVNKDLYRACLQARGYQRT